MDNARGRRMGPTLGPRRGEDKCIYPGPQAEVENNEYHRAPQRIVGHEEVGS
jgi:hypothetical protein